MALVTILVQSFCPFYFIQKERFFKAVNIFDLETVIPSLPAMQTNFKHKLGLANSITAIERNIVLDRVVVVRMFCDQSRTLVLRGHLKVDPFTPDCKTMGLTCCTQSGN